MYFGRGQTCVFIYKSTWQQPPATTNIQNPLWVVHNVGAESISTQHRAEINSAPTCTLVCRDFYIKMEKKQGREAP